MIISVNKMQTLIMRIQSSGIEFGSVIFSCMVTGKIGSMSATLCKNNLKIDIL